MADAQVLYAEAFNVTANSTAWVDVCTIAAGSFTTGKRYAIIANIISKIATSASNDVRVRLVHGTTPTVFDDASLSWEGMADTQEHEESYLFFYTQPGTTELVKLQISTSATNTVTALVGQIIAINLDDVGTEGTHYFSNEFLTNYTMTNTPTAKAITSSFTPNGTDRWLFIGHQIFDVGATITTPIGMELYDSVAGVLNSCQREGEDATNDFEGSVLYWVGVPTNAARTLAVRPFQTGATPNAVSLASRVIAINLARFAQSASAFSANEVDPATTPTYTTLATVSPTPTNTGNWVHIGFSNNDTNEFATTDLEVRMQVNPDGGGLVSRPNSPTTSPSIDGWDNTDENPISLFYLGSLTSGAPRPINWDCRQVAGTTGRMEDNGLVAFSVALAEAPGSISGTVALILGQAGAIAGAGALSATGVLALGQTGALAGAGALAGISELTTNQTGILSGSGALSGNSALAFGQAGDLIGAGTLAGTSEIIIGQTGTLDQPAGDLEGATAIAFGQTGALSGAGILAGVSNLVIGEVGSITGEGILSSAAILTIGQTGALAGNGALGGVSTIIFDQTGILDQPSGSISGTVALAFDQIGDIAGAGALVGISSLIFSEIGALSGAGDLAGNSNLVFSEIGALEGAGVLSGVSAWIISAVDNSVSITGVMHISATAVTPMMTATAVAPSLEAVAVRPSITAIAVAPDMEAIAVRPSITATAI